MLWSNGWDLRERFEVFTDANFHIFYFFPACVGLMLLRSDKRWLFVSIVTLLLSAYALTQLQTRSGIIMLGVALLLSALVCLRFGTVKPLHIILGLVVGSYATYYYFSDITNLASGLLERFTMANVESLNGRLGSADYLFATLIDPAYWMPRGQADFFLKFGGVPHFNPTAIYLLSGIFGLLAWCYLQLWYLWKSTARLVKGELNPVFCIAFICSSIMFLISLSLNVPYKEQVWLWNGALIGGFYRSTRTATSTQLQQEVSDANSSRLFQLA
jgi:hypothetical protein